MLPMLEENGPEHAGNYENTAPDAARSPVELRTDLADARITSAGDDSKS